MPARFRSAPIVQHCVCSIRPLPGHVCKVAFLHPIATRYAPDELFECRVPNFCRCGGGGPQFDRTLARLGRCWTFLRAKGDASVVGTGGAAAARICIDFPVGARAHCGPHSSCTTFAYCNPGFCADFPLFVFMRYCGQPSGTTARFGYTKGNATREGGYPCGPSAPITLNSGVAGPRLAAGGRPPPTSYAPIVDHGGCRPAWDIFLSECFGFITRFFVCICVSLFLSPMSFLSDTIGGSHSHVDRYSCLGHRIVLSTCLRESFIFEDVGARGVAAMSPPPLPRIIVIDCGALIELGTLRVTPLDLLNGTALPVCISNGGCTSICWGLLPRGVLNSLGGGSCATWRLSRVQVGWHCLVISPVVMHRHQSCDRSAVNCSTCWHVASQFHAQFVAAHCP